MRNPEDNEIGILVGSGISIPADFPSTNKITDSIFTDCGDSNSNKLIKAIRDETKFYFSQQLNRDMNYEDLYYIAQQLHSEMMRDHPNPLLFNLPAAIISKMPANESVTGSDMAHYYSVLMKNIERAVWQQLRKIPAKFDHLSIIEDILNNGAFGKMSIFTLNHDTLLEQYFQKIGAKYTDGFFDDNRWDLSILTDSDAAIGLFKIHGSINWFFAKENETDAEIYVKIDPESDINKVKSELMDRLKLRYLNSDEPVLLIGTTNKMLEYSGGIFRDFFCLTNSRLRKIDRLIVCGYGFRDRGVNNLLIDWLISSRKKHVVIIHSDPENLTREASGAIQSIFIKNANNGKINFIKKNMGDESLSWTEIKKFL